MGGRWSTASGPSPRSAPIARTPADGRPVSGSDSGAQSNSSGVPDPAALGQRWRQVLADVGYLRRELARLGPREGYVRRAQNFDEQAVRKVAAFERVYERLANELDRMVRDYLKGLAPSSDAEKAVEDSPMAGLFSAFATARRLPAPPSSSASP
jgi:hypothetical protein